MNRQHMVHGNGFVPRIFWFERAGQDKTSHGKKSQKNGTNDFLFQRHLSDLIQSKRFIKNKQSVGELQTLKKKKPKNRLRLFSGKHFKNQNVGLVFQRFDFGDAHFVGDCQSVAGFQIQGIDFGAALGDLNPNHASHA